MSKVIFCIILVKVTKQYNKSLKILNQSYYFIKSIRSEFVQKFLNILAWFVYQEPIK